MRNNIELPSLAEASAATGIAPNKIEFLRHYRDNPEVWGREMPLVLCPAQPCLLDWFGFVQSEILNSAAHSLLPSLRAMNGGHQVLVTLFSDDEQDTQYLVQPLIGQYRKIYNSLWGIDDFSDLRDRESLQSDFRFGIIQPGKRQNNLRYHYDDAPENPIISIACASSLTTEFAARNNREPKKGRYATPAMLEDWIKTTGAQITSPPTGMLYAFDGTKAPHAPQEARVPTYRYFIVAELHLNNP